MKAIERNLSQHANGNLYVVARRNGKLEVKSLKTKDLKEARRLLREPHAFWLRRAVLVAGN